MLFSPFVQILFFSVAAGFGWIGYAKVYGLGFPFWASGWLTGVWFLPALFAASVQGRSGVRRVGWIFFAESLAALVSAALGPMGWVSFQFGVAQGLLGEIGFHFQRSVLATALGAALADLILLALHPGGFAVGQSTVSWVGHALGVFLSAAILARGVDAIVKRASPHR